jgi:hypothetical protein
MTNEKFQMANGKSSFKFYQFKGYSGQAGMPVLQR